MKLNSSLFLSTKAVWIFTQIQQNDLHDLSISDMIIQMYCAS